MRRGGSRGVPGFRDSENDSVPVVNGFGSGAPVPRLHSPNAPGAPRLEPEASGRHLGGVNGLARA